MSTLGKEYAILLKTKIKTETRIKTMKQKREKLYYTDCVSSIGVDATHTTIAMTVGVKIVVISIPSNDFKIHDCSDCYKNGDSLADWLNRNCKEL